MKLQFQPLSNGETNRRLDCISNGDHARPGRSEPRPRGSQWRTKKSNRLATSNASEFGARAHRTAPGAGAVPMNSWHLVPATKLSPVAAFTLIELLIAIAISAVLLAAIGSVLFVALKMRDGSMRATGQTAPVDRAVAIMKHDLACVVPVGKLAGPMGTDASVNGMTVAPQLEIFTGSAIVNADDPWGDVQKIDYSLQSPTNRLRYAGRNLVRSVTRNLLASGTVLPDQQALLEDVSTLQFTYYDGTNWNDTWSTSLSNIPVAIRVNIELADNGGARSVQSPIRFVVPVVAWSNTNSITNQISN